MRVRSKPIEAEAVQWKGDNFTEMKVFAGNAVHAEGPLENIRIRVYASVHVVIGGAKKWIPLTTGDWLVRTSPASFYVFTDAQFRGVYEIIEDSVR